MKAPFASSITNWRSVAISRQKVKATYHLAIFETSTLNSTGWIHVQGTGFPTFSFLSVKGTKLRPKELAVGQVMTNRMARDRPARLQRGAATRQHLRLDFLLLCRTAGMRKPRKAPGLRALPILSSGTADYRCHSPVLCWFAGLMSSPFCTCFFSVLAHQQ